MCRQWATGQMSVAGIAHVIHEARTRAKYEMQQVVLILWEQLDKRVGFCRQMRARASLAVATLRRLSHSARPPQAR